jgi:hypothetical protein
MTLAAEWAETADRQWSASCAPKINLPSSRWM